MIRRQGPLPWVDGDKRNRGWRMFAKVLWITPRVALVVVPDLLLFHRHGGHIGERSALIVRCLEIDEEV